MPDLQPSGRGEYEITDAIQMLIDRGETVLAGVYEGDWFDTGTLDSFLETSFYLSKGESLNEGTLEGEAGPQVIIGEGATVSVGKISDSVVLPGANVTVTGEVRHAVLGGTVKVDGDVVNAIVYDDDRR